jgi:uncharacterized SAM-binding protein YcdF (DUF218 family)
MIENKSLSSVSLRRWTAFGRASFRPVGFGLDFRLMIRRMRNLLLLVLLGGLLIVLLSAVSIYAFSRRDETREADAAIVLGAAVFGERPSPVLRERINHAIDLYEAGYVDKIIFTGGLGQTARVTEAEAAAAYARARGVPDAAILVETTSTTTRENLRNARLIAAENELQSFLIVSTPFHMKRAIAIADDLSMEAYSSPTRTIRWINGYTKSRAFVQEVVSYIVYLFWGVGSWVIGNW